MKRIAELTKSDYTLTTDIEESYHDPYILRSKGHFHFSIEDGYVSTLEIQLDISNQEIISYLHGLPRLDKLHIFYFHKPANLGEILQWLGFELIKHEEDFMVFHKHNY